MMNVGQLESMNDIVGGITGDRVCEIVPDWLSDEANVVVVVVVVDLAPVRSAARPAGSPR